MEAPLDIKGGRPYILEGGWIMCRIYVLTIFVAYSCQKRGVTYSGCEG